MLCNNCLGNDLPAQPYQKLGYETELIEGWQLHVHQDLKQNAAPQYQKARELLKLQLQEINKVVPQKAVTELKKVPLWMSPPYKDERPHAAFHPSASWLKEHQRLTEMAECVEFTNIAIFEAESRRMPNFALHELAHAYHFRVLPLEFNNPEVKDAYQQAKKSGKYEKVERQDSEGRKKIDKSYALTNQQEYFAELTEAYFSKNDFYPYNNQELKEFDPAGYEMIEKMWGVQPK